MKRIVSLFLAVCLTAGLICLGTVQASAAGVDWQIPDVIPAYTKAYSANYEIVVDTWDYHNLATDEKGTVQADTPYRYGPAETRIFQLENGKYWLHQLYQHRIEWQGPNEHGHYVAVGFRAESMVSFLGANNGFEYLNDSSDLGATEFTIWDGDEAVFVPGVILKNSAPNDGTYADAFLVSALPGTVPFTLDVRRRAGHSNNFIECTFHGTIRFTNVSEIESSRPSTWMDSLPQWFVLILRYLFFGWLWMK